MKRRVVLWVILAAAIWVVATHTADVANLWTTVRGGSPWWLALAAGLQGVYYVCYTASYREAFRTVGIERSLRELAPPVIGSFFVNVVMPAGGAAGPALVIDDAVRRGHSPARSTVAMVLTQTADFSAFGLVMVSGFVYLAALGRLQSYEVLAAFVLVALVAVFAAVLVIGAVRPVWLRGLLAWVERVGARLSRAVRREPSIGWSDRLADEASEASRVLAEHPAGVARTVGVAFVGYLVDLASLMAISFAFGWTMPGSIVAAYAVGVLLWIVSIVPQGIGVVEGAMGLVLVSFGASAASAAAIALVFRGLSFWLPFAFGPLLLRHVASFEPRREEASGAFTVRTAAVLTFAAGMVDIVSAVTPSVPLRFRMLEPFLGIVGVATGRFASALAGVALLLVSRGLWNRKRTAWAVTIAVLAVSIASHLAKGLDYEEALIAAGLMAWLLTQRSEFHARADRPSVAQGLRVLAAAFAATLAYGTIGFYLLDRQFSVNFGLGAAVRQTTDMFVRFYDPGLEPVTGLGRYFADSIYMIAAASIGFALIMLLRSVLVRDPATPEERAKAEAIVTAHGSSSIARMALLPDKSYWFSEGGSVVAFVVYANCALALGDPIGPAGDAAAAIEGFVRMCRNNGWTSVFYETVPELDDAYRRQGFHLARIGHEAIVDVRTFSLAGKSRKSLRNRINRLEEEGYVATVLSPPHSARTLRSLRAVSETWLTAMQGTEKRFSLGWFDDDYLQECPVMTVTGSDGVVVAFANLIPEYQRNESTIDLMRHRPSAPAGTMDYMFVRLFEWAGANGFETFNLGVASLAGVGGERDDPAVEKVMRLVYEHANQFYGFKGLHAYKEKFDPTWEARGLAYPDVTDLPRVLAGLVQADSGGHMVRGYLRSLTTARRLPTNAEPTPSGNARA